MTIFDKIWYEMLDSKMREYYCTKYLKFHRSIKRWYKIATLVFSTSGILGWAFFKDPTLGIITSAIVSIISLLQLIEGQLFHNDEQLDAVCQLIKCYETRFRQCEQIFLQLNAYSIEDSSASTLFYQQSEVYAIDIFEHSKKLTINDYKKMKANAEFESQSYLKRYNRS